MAEHLTVAQVVVGSSPIIRPGRASFVEAFFFSVPTLFSSMNFSS